MATPQSDRPSSQFLPQEERFNLLCLDAQEEYYFRDHRCVLHQAGQQAIDGHLKVCSAGLYFVPRDAQHAIVRIPYTSTTAIDEVGDGEAETEGATLRNALDNAFSVECTLRVCMKPGNRDVPYKRLQGPSSLTLALVYAALEDVLSQVQELWALALQLDSGTKPGRAEAAARLHQIIADHEEGERFNPGWLDDDERILLELPGSRITPLCVQPGRVVLTPRHVYFQPFNVVSNAPVQAHPLEGATGVGRRRYQLEDQGLELFFGAKSSLFLAFRTPADREAFLQQLQAQPVVRVSKERSLAAWTRDWVAGRVSNFDYLLQLNREAGRSFNDLSQYPIFPWVLADYTSPRLDLSNPAVFRDLSRPVAALSEARARHGRETFAALQSAELPDPPWMHGSHYSNPGFVVFYLARANPQLMLRLQNGRFDSADRLFCSIREAWESVNTWDSDVKELIPEFYTTADGGSFLVNSSGADFGVRSTGAAVRDVQLPPWAEGPADFVRKMAEALESAIVSERLHLWIDLIFGVKSRGKGAEKADNVFNFMTYDEVAIEYLKQERDPFLLDAYRTQVREYGRTPRQLFTSKHPRQRGAPVLQRLLGACVCVTPAEQTVPPPRTASFSVIRAQTKGASRDGTPALRAVLKVAGGKATTRQAALEWLEQAAATREPDELIMGQGATAALEALVARAAAAATGQGDEARDLPAALVRAAAVLVTAPANRRAMLDGGMLEPLVHAATALNAPQNLAFKAFKALATLSEGGDPRLASLGSDVVTKAAEGVVGWTPGQPLDALTPCLVLVASLSHFAAKRRIFTERHLQEALLQRITDLSTPGAEASARSGWDELRSVSMTPGEGISPTWSMSGSLQSSPTPSVYGAAEAPAGSVGAMQSAMRQSRGRRRSSGADLSRFAARRQAALALAALLQDDAQKELLLGSDAGLPTILGLTCSELPALRGAGWECVAVLSTLPELRQRLMEPQLLQELLLAAGSGSALVQRPAAACVGSLIADKTLAAAEARSHGASAVPALIATVVGMAQAADEEVQCQAAGALWHVMHQVQRRAAAVNAGALPALLRVGADRRAVRAQRLAVQALRPCAEDPDTRPRLQAAAAEAGIDLEALFAAGGAWRSLSHVHSDAHHVAAALAQEHANGEQGGSDGNSSADAMPLAAAGEAEGGAGSGKGVAAGKDVALRSHVITDVSDEA